MILSSRYHYSPAYIERSQLALETALSSAPFYQNWRQYDPGPQASLEARYDAMPELTKKDMRDHFPKGLVSKHLVLDEALARGEVGYTFTSGTTAERVINIWNQRWWDNAEAASWKLNAHLARLDYPQKEAKLASSLNVGIQCEDDLPMANRILGRTLYLNEKVSLISWQPRHMIRMARELQSYQPVILEANASLLARLAFWAWDEGVELYAPPVIVFTFELPSLLHLAAIRRVFSSALVSSYGTTETGFVMEQCEAGVFHQNTNYCHIDYQPLAERHGGPELGRILVTTFGNPWANILRFDVGDLVRLHPAGECTCGCKEGFMVQSIEGRVANATFTTAGRLVTSQELDTALSQTAEIRDYHFEQHNPLSYTLTLMLSDHSSPVLQQIRSILAALYGDDGSYEILPVANLLPGPSGKFRRTQANFTFDQKGLFA